MDEATGATYNPAAYPDHGAGLFFVGRRAGRQDHRLRAQPDHGRLHARRDHRERLPEGHGARVRARDHPPVGGLRRQLRRPHRDAGHRAVGPNAGRFVVTNIYERPAGMPNLNNEGFAIAPQAECVNGLKPVFWADDSNTGGHALRAGTLNCTVPDAGPAPTPHRHDADAHGTTPPATPTTAGTPTQPVRPARTAPGSSSSRSSSPSRAPTRSAAPASSASRSPSASGRT